MDDKQIMIQYVVNVCAIADMRLVMDENNQRMILAYNHGGYHLASCQIGAWTSGWRDAFEPDVNIMEKQHM